MGVDPCAKKYGGNTHLYRSSALSKDEAKPILSISKITPS